MLAISVNSFNFRDFSDFINQNEEVFVLSKIEYESLNSISQDELTNRINDIKANRNCGFHELVEVDDE
ncbi:hypothetical protein AGMMS49975_17560 [Clostridia bacterium]|nr:hypothetical protein AGMMS49975_17560 [Clostridia bacterium]